MRGAEAARLAALSADSLPWIPTWTCTEIKVNRLLVVERRWWMRTNVRGFGCEVIGNSLEERESLIG